MRSTFLWRWRRLHLWWPVIFAVRIVAAEPASDLVPRQQVGLLSDGTQFLPSGQILRVEGQRLECSGRPVDLALAPDGKTVFVKNMKNLLVVDAASWTLSQALDYPGSGASLHGITVAHDG